VGGKKFRECRKGEPEKRSEVRRGENITLQPLETSARHWGVLPLKKKRKCAKRGGNSKGHRGQGKSVSFPSPLGKNAMR